MQVYSAFPMNMSTLDDLDEHPKLIFLIFKPPYLMMICYPNSSTHVNSPLHSDLHKTLYWLSYELREIVCTKLTTLSQY